MSTPEHGHPPADPGAPAGDEVLPPLVLDPTAAAVSGARRHVREALRACGAEDLEESGELGVSELVTNAVLHARTRLELTVRTTARGTVRIEVADASPAPPRQRRFGTSSTTGRGLRLVESAAVAWGIDPHPPARGPGKTVWFEPAPSLSTAGFAAEDWAADVEALL